MPSYNVSDKTIPRQAAVSIEYDYTGSGSLSAGAMMKYLENYSYTDPATGEANSASITLYNMDMLWASKRLPKKGDKFTAYIDRFNWDSPGKNARFPCGTFCCDDINFEFPSNVTAVVNGTSVPAKRNFSAKVRSKTWKKITIKEIARRIVKRYKLKLNYYASKIKVATLEQSNKTDLEFLNEMCSSYGLYIKVYRGKVVIYDAARYEKKAAVATISYKDIISGSYNSTLAGTYTGATIKYTKGSGKKKKQKEYIYKIGTGTRRLVISEKVDGLRDARIKAKAKLLEENRKAETMQITVASSKAMDLYAGTNIKITGAYAMTGKWFIEKVTHNVSGSGGYTVQLDLHRVSEATTSVPQAALKKGTRVKVTGKAYVTSNGGKAKKLKNKKMYVLQVAGGNHKYPYAVSFRKGGKRYGWCARSSLTKVSSKKKKTKK